MGENPTRQLWSSGKKDLVELSGLAGLETAKREKDIAQLFEELRKLNGKMHKMQDNLEKQLTGMLDNMQSVFEKQINSKIDRVNPSLQKSINDRLTAVMSELERHGHGIKDTLDIQVRLQSQLQVLEEEMSSEGAAAGQPKARFDPNLSIIVAGLPMEDEENVLDKVKLLFAEGLGIESDIVDAIPLNRRGKQPGLAKIECVSREEKNCHSSLKTKAEGSLWIWKSLRALSQISHWQADQTELLDFAKRNPYGRDFFITCSGREFMDRGEREPAGDCGSECGGRESQHNWNGKIGKHTEHLVVQDY